MAAKRKTTTTKAAGAGAAAREKVASLRTKTARQQGADFADQVAGIDKAFSSFFDGLNERARQNRLEDARSRLPSEEKKAEWDREIVVLALTEAGKPMSGQDLTSACARLGLRDPQCAFAVGGLAHMGKVEVVHGLVHLVKANAPEAPPVKPETETPVSGHLFAAEFAQALGVSRDQVEAWIASGMPHERHKLRLGGPVSIPLLAACTWIHARQNTPETAPLEEKGAAPAEVEGAAPEFSAPFEAASPPPPPKLPEVTIPVSVDVVLGVDAMLRNAILQMGLGDNEGVRRNLQGAIKKLYPAFEETGKALTGKMRRL